jgi:hypothetical protein
LHSGLWWLWTTIPEGPERKGWNVYSYISQEKLTEDAEAEARMQKQRQGCRSRGKEKKCDASILSSKVGANY